MVTSGTKADPAVSVDSDLARVVDVVTARLRAGAVTVDELFAEFPEYAKQLERLLPAMALLADVSRSAGQSPEGIGTPRADEGEPIPGILGDFRIIREIGRGGMGVVYEAEQISLGRRVALKVLPFAATMDPKQLQRFHNEAKAAASLKHEHIVQVHAVGCERGVHFYAMEFVEGQTLAQMISGRAESQERPQNDPEPVTSPNPAAPTKPRSPDTAPVAALSTERTGLKGRTFCRSVAETIADAADALEHAHSLGIVHRDIKPGNLLLDAAGKVYVSDFGLARFGPDAGLTMSGDLLGTLRYMAPEQALARHGLADHRVDVYGLGCTLYELLTGKPAVGGTDKADILRHIAFEEPISPRKLDKAIPTELETIALKCLAKNPSERYATAGELAADLRRWLEDQPIKARRPTAWQRLGRWGRRHPGLTATLGLAAGLALAGGWAWHRETIHAETGARAVAAEADELRQADRLPEALQAARRAADLLPRIGGDATLRREVEERMADLQLLNRIEEARLEEVSGVDSRGSFDHQRAAARFRQAFQEYGVDVLAGDEAHVAEAFRHRAIAAEIAVGLGEWGRLGNLGPAETERLNRLTEVLDTEPRHFLPRICHAMEAKDIAALKKLAAEAEVDLPPPSVVYRLGNALRNSKAFAEAERLLRAGQQRYPSDYWINRTLGSMLLQMEPKRSADGVRFANVALALRPLSFVAWTDLGALLLHAGRYEEGVAAFRRSIALNPDTVEGHNGLGWALKAQGRYVEAEAPIRRAIALRPGEPRHYSNLAQALFQMGRWEEAEESDRQAVALGPGVPRYHHKLGATLMFLGRWADAEASFREVIRLKPDYGEAYDFLGIVLGCQKRLVDAEAANRRAVALMPDNATAHMHLAAILHEQERFEEAVASFHRAIELQPSMAGAHLGLGTALRCLDRFQESLEAFRRCPESGSKSPASSSDSPAEDVKDAERLVALAPRLPSLLAGEVKPTRADDLIALAALCQDKKLFVAADRFYAALASDPKLADGPNTQRYNAARAAAQAGCGEGKDAGRLDGAERARLRRQALEWLTADHAALPKRAGTPAGRATLRMKMLRWQASLEFAGVRDAAELAKLPEAERVAWQKLWADVAALQKRCEEPRATAQAPKPASP